jgi:hypothetical protein
MDLAFSGGVGGKGTMQKLLEIDRRVVGIAYSGLPGLLIQWYRDKTLFSMRTRQASP